MLKRNQKKIPGEMDLSETGGLDNDNRIMNSQKRKRYSKVIAGSGESSNNESNGNLSKKRKKSPDVFTGNESVDSEEGIVEDSGEESVSDSELVFAEMLSELPKKMTGSKGNIKSRNKREDIEVIHSDTDESLESDSVVDLYDRWTKSNKQFPEKKKMLEYWSLFVNLSQCQQQADAPVDADQQVAASNLLSVWNPYQASLQHVAVYLFLLKDMKEVSQVELEIIKEVIMVYLPHLELETKSLHELLDLASDPALTIPHKLRSLIHYTKYFSKMCSTSGVPGMKAWRAFVDYCLGKTKKRGQINPFLADQNTVRDYILHLLNGKDEHFKELKDAGVRSEKNFFEFNIRNLCQILGKFLQQTYCGKDVIDSVAIQDLLVIGRHLDGRIPISSSKIGPDYDFTQYTAKEGNFWQLNLVKLVLKDVRSSVLDRKKAAWQLGVTEDMIDTALQVETKDPEFNLTLELYIKQGFGSEQTFWEEFSTVDLLNQVRNIKVTVKDVAFILGVSRAKLSQKVGRIKSEEEMKEEKKLANVEKRKSNYEKQFKKPTQLEKQIKIAEDNIESLSDYEIMRLENLRERQALLVSLNIIEDKKALKLMTVTPNGSNMPVDYGTREKSSRIRRKKEEFVPRIAVEAEEYMYKSSPKWVGRWYPQSTGKSNGQMFNIPLTAEDFNLASPVPQVDFTVREVFSSNNDYHKSTRFMNSISMEFEEVADEKLPVKNIFSGFSKIADSKVSSSEIRCVDTFGDLVCYGDSSGGVGVFLDERSATLKIHNEPVTRTVFVGGSHGRGILSASLDGTVRLTDLVKQEVTMKYSWIQSGEKEQIGWIEPWEGSTFLMNSNRNTVKIMDLRIKEVDTLFSVPGLKYLDLGYSSEAELLKTASHDPAFGTNIGVHPVSNNLLSFCQQTSVKIFDMRNVSQPLTTILVDEIRAHGRPNHHTKGVSGANWSPESGKYFLVCPIKTPHINEDAKQYHYPYIFDSDHLEEPVQIWPAKKGKCTNSSFSNNYGASWCPWQEGVFFTTAVYRYNAFRPEGIPSYYTVVAIDAGSGAIVSEISEDLDNSKYLVECHKTRNWVVVGNARGPGDLVIYKTAE